MVHVTTEEAINCRTHNLVRSRRASFDPSSHLAAGGRRRRPLPPPTRHRHRPDATAYFFSSVVRSILPPPVRQAGEANFKPGFLWRQGLQHTMPIKWVLHWLPNPGTTVNTQILSEISQSIEGLNGVKGGRWKAVLTFYKPILRDQSFIVEFPRDFMGLSFSDQPEKYYFVIRGQRLVVEADSSIQTIMEKLQSYKQRVSLNFEGTQYHLGDFQVKVEKVTPSQSESMRGIVMEVEYLAISSIERSRLIMEDFVDALQEALSKKTLPGRFMHYEPSFSEYGLSDQYGMQHTTIQYATVMAQLIATAQSAQAMRN